MFLFYLCCYSYSSWSPPPSYRISWVTIFFYKGVRNFQSAKQQRVNETNCCSLRVPLANKRLKVLFQICSVLCTTSLYRGSTVYVFLIKHYAFGMQCRRFIKWSEKKRNSQETYTNVLRSATYINIKKKHTNTNTHTHHVYKLYNIHK